MAAAGSSDAVGQTTSARTQPPNAVPTAAAVLGAAGLIPFFAGAVAGAMPATIGSVTDLPGSAIHALAINATLAYGAIILSFLGGVQWGLAMDRKPGFYRLGISVVPALIGWVALLISGREAVLVLILAFVCLMAIDQSWASRGAAPRWYPWLRWPLTIGVVGSLGTLALV